MDYKTLIRKIKKGDLDKVYFLYGDEIYIIDKLIEALLEQVVDPQTREFNFDVFYADEIAGDVIVNIASSFPMMSERRLIIIKSIQKLSVSARELLLKYVDSPLSSTCLVLTAGRVDKRKKFYSKLLKKSISADCKPLYEDQAIIWIKKQFRKSDVSISDEAIRMIVQYVGTSMRNLENEINKVLTFTYSKKIIGKEEISNLVGFYRNFKIWDLLDAVGGKDLNSSLKILYRMLEDGLSPPWLISQLSTRIFLLKKIRLMLNKGMKKNELMKSLRLKFFHVNLYLEQVKNFSLEKLDNSLNILIAADHSLKTGYMKPEMILTFAIYDLIINEKNKIFFID